MGGAPPQTTTPILGHTIWRDNSGNSPPNKVTMRCDLSTFKSGDRSSLYIFGRGACFELRLLGKSHPTHVQVADLTVPLV